MYIINNSVLKMPNYLLCGYSQILTRNRNKPLIVLCCLLFSAQTLAQELQSWSVKIDDGAKRFKILKDFNNAAVLDKETQLVWERRPNHDFLKWEDAVIHCQNAAVGGRMGWRLPSMTELSSILDLSVANDFNKISFAPNHPFILTNLGFWSTDKYYEKPLAISLHYGGIGALDLKHGKEQAWCVRSS